MNDATKLYELIEALKIFDLISEDAETCCEHDVLMVCGVGKNEVTPGDLVRLEAFGFGWSSEYDCFCSTRHGSC